MRFINKWQIIKVINLKDEITKITCKNSSGYSVIEGKVSTRIERYSWGKVIIE